MSGSPTGSRWPASAERATASRAARAPARAACATAIAHARARLAASAELFERDGRRRGAIVPACPERSVVNSVSYRDAGALARRARRARRAPTTQAGVEAWTVWVPEVDREAARCSRRPATGSTATPTAMVARPRRAAEPELGDLDWDAERRRRRTSARINDLAYGFDGRRPSRAALGRPAAGRRCASTRRGSTASRPACSATIDHGDDCGVYFVATSRSTAAAASRAG